MRTDGFKAVSAQEKNAIDILQKRHIVGNNNHGLILQQGIFEFLAIGALSLEYPDVPVQDRQDRLEVVSRHGDQEPLVGALQPGVFKLGLEPCKPLVRFLFELLAFKAQIELLDGPRDRVAKDARVDRLSQEVVCPLFQGFDDRLQRRRRGQEGKREMGELAKRVLEEVKAALISHVQFRENDRLPLLPVKNRRRLLKIGHRRYGISLPGKRFCRLGKEGRIVVDQEYAEATHG